jgi:hypothetical protein
MRYAPGKSRILPAAIRFIFVWGVIAFFYQPSGALAVHEAPDLGGNPSLTHATPIQQDGLDLEIFSYAYEATGMASDIPASLPVPDPDLSEWLYVYLLSMGNEPSTYPDSVIGFDVSNFYRVAINQVGTDTTIVPDEGQPDEYLGARQLPSAFQSNLVAGTVDFSFSDPTLDPFSDPAGDYSILYFLAEGSPDDVNGKVATDNGILDLNQMGLSLIGPVPEPASLALLLIGIPVLLGRKSRRF